MNNFEFYMPTRIVFGKDTHCEAGAYVKQYGGTKVLLHFGGTYLRENGLLDAIEKSLTDNGIEFIEFDKVVPNPRLHTIYEGAQICRDNGIDFILAIGGGSAIDSSKGIAAAAKMDGDVWDAYLGKATIEDALPIGVVLTIPASGSESSKVSVVVKEETKEKKMAGSYALLPKFAILNPETTYTLPAFQTAAGGFDIISHLFERYFTQTEYVEFSDRLLESGVITVMNNVPVVLADPKNYNARSEIMWVGNVAHNDLLGKGREEDWATHNIEQEVTGHYDITHGASLAIITPAWMKYTYKANKKRFVQFATRIMKVDMAADREEDMILAAIDKLETMLKSWGLPTRLSDMGIGSELFEEMAENVLNGGETTGAFMKLTKEDIINIYNLAL